MFRASLPSLIVFSIVSAPSFGSAAEPPSGSPGPYGPSGPQPEFGLRLPNGERARPHFDLGARTAPGAVPAWDRFRAMHDAGSGSWTALWNRDTGTPARVYGRYIEAPGATADAEAARDAAREVLFRHLDLFAPGVEPSSFVLRANHLSHDGTYRSVGFEQVHRGMPVVGGQISVRIKNDRIFVLASEAIPRVNVPRPELRVPAPELRRIAEAWIRSERGGQPTSRPDVDGPMVLPILTEDGLNPVAVLKVVVDLPDPFEEWHVFLDPESGEPMAREQKLLYASGTLRFDVPDRYPLVGRTVVPAANLTVDGTTTGGDTFTVTTDENGTFSWQGSDDATIRNPEQERLQLDPQNFVISGLSGPEVRVADLTRLNGGTRPFAVDFPGNQAGTATLGSPNDQFEDANFNTFAAVQVVRDRVLAIDPGNAWLNNNQTLALTNLSQTCNAVANQQFIALFRGSSRCANTGRIDDVVHHEMGHTVHANSVIPGVGRFVADYSEGLSDYLAATINDDAGMGRGFFRTNAPLRELDPPTPNTWSRVGSDPVQHTRGLAYAGAQWDLRKALVRKLGPEAGVEAADRLWFETLRRASSILTTYVETVAADDDDGDLGNGTPNFCAILDAFETHELAAGAEFGVSIGDARIDGLAVEVPTVEPPVDCNRPSQAVDDVILRWRTEDTDEVRTLELEESEGIFSGSFSDVEPGTLVEYGIRVVRGDGETVRFPENDASPRYQTFYGDLDELMCRDFSEDPFTEAGGFTTRVFSGNDEWDWGVPAGNANDPTGAFSGDRIVGTNLGGAYGRGNVSQLALPAVDVSSYDRVLLRYRRWLTVFDFWSPEFRRRFDQASIISNDIVVWESGVDTRPSAFEDAEWRQHFVDLSETTRDGEVNVGFELSTSGRIDPSFVTGGWNVDDVCIAGFRPPDCGNGTVEVTEACDDGNPTDGDGCESDCTVSPNPVCGNGIVEAGEACDDGNDDDTDDCTSECTVSPNPVCGNGIVEAGEACDDGNDDDTDDCTSECTVPDDSDSNPSGPGLAASDGGCVCVGSEAPAATSALLLLALGALLSGRRRR